MAMITVINIKSQILLNHKITLSTYYKITVLIINNHNHNHTYGSTRLGTSLLVCITLN
jgi:hypothetical protein